MYRTNLAFAALTMNDDIGLSTFEYCLGSGLFFFLGYAHVMHNAMKFGTAVSNHLKQGPELLVPAGTSSHRQGTAVKLCMADTSGSPHNSLAFRLGSDLSCISSTYYSSLLIAAHLACVLTVPQVSCLILFTFCT